MRYIRTRDLRRAFWSRHAHLHGSNDPCLVRQTFVEYIDALRRANLITDRLAFNATLGDY
jgi:hypothetical protein